MWVKLILFGIATIVVAAGFALLRKPVYCPPGMRQAEGTVVGTAEVSGLYGAFQAAVIEFTPEGGDPVTIKLGQPSSYRVGDRLSVNYDPYDPARDWSISRQSTWRAYVAIAIGLAIGIAGVLVKVKR